jgi:hypothetical protein
MSISFIIISGLPVLYLTGSLKKAVSITGLSSIKFILFFLITGVLSFIPELRVAQGIHVSFAGAFFSIAPAVYIAIKKQYSYRYYLFFVLTILFAVALSFFISIYSMPYLPYIIDLVIALAAGICFMPRGPVFAPVIMGVYGLAGGLMQLFSGLNNSITIFGNMDMTSLSTALCLFVSYILRPKGRHTEGYMLQTQDNKG